MTLDLGYVTNLSDGTLALGGRIALARWEVHVMNKLIVVLSIRGT